MFRSCALVLAGLVAVLPLASGEHVHEVDDHGHVQYLVHRHIQAHGVATAHRDAVTVDHQDQPVATIAQDYTIPPGISMAAPAVAAVAALVPAPPILLRARQAGFDDRLIHGPPRAPTAQRGPPTDTLL